MHDWVQRWTIFTSEYRLWSLHWSRCDQSCYNQPSARFIQYATSTIYIGDCSCLVCRRFLGWQHRRGNSGNINLFFTLCLACSGTRNCAGVPHPHWTQYLLQHQQLVVGQDQLDGSGADPAIHTLTAAYSSYRVVGPVVQFGEYGCNRQCSGKSTASCEVDWNGHPCCFKNVGTREL